MDKTTPASLPAMPPFGAVPGVRGDGRVPEIDGIRGWCALGICFAHMFWMMFANIVPGFRNPVTAFVLDGQLGLGMFFILSGEALSTVYFLGKGPKGLLRLAVRRGPRLAVPVIAVSLLVWLEVQGGLVLNTQAARFVHLEDWFGAVLQFPVTLAYTLKYALVTVYLSRDPAAQVVPFLWTMKDEMAGTLAILAFLLLVPLMSMPRSILWLYVVILAVLPQSICNNMACFLAGILFADFRWHGGFARARNARWSWLSWPVVAAVAVIDSHLHLQNYDCDRHILAAVMLFAIFCNRHLVWFFSCPLSAFLGRISFSLYLVQFPVMISATSAAIIWAATHGGLTLAAAWIICLGSVALFVLGALIFLPVEVFGRWTGGHLAQLLLPASPRSPRKTATAA